MPITIASVTDALVALRRISTFLRADELAVPYTIDPSSDSAIDVDGDFMWESVGNVDASPKFAETGDSAEKGNSNQAKDGEDADGKGGTKEKDDAKPILPTTATDAAGQPSETGNGAKQEEKPFELKDLNLKIPRGSFVAIVGRIGSGKVCTS